MKKFVLEVSPQGCGKVFREWGEVTTDISILNKPEKVALVIFTGGEDVWPELYGESAHRSTSYNLQRDIYEGRLFEKAIDLPKVGICRGSQFLCVKAGGKLVQDISGHTRGHSITTNDGRILNCNSSHHQMQFPPPDAVPLAWSTSKLSSHYSDGDDLEVDVDKEYEVVYYPKIKAVGAQFHPEWVSEDHECARYIKEVVKKYLFSDL